MTVRMAPSILAADFARLGEEVAAVTRAGADLVHVDVMDGHFVPNISIGVPVVKSLKRVATLPLDVHLMISDPDRYLEAFVEAGAAMLTVHAEAVSHLHRTLTRIRELGAKAGVALNPSTPIGVLADVVCLADHVLIMSVNPGFGGQSFIPHTLTKIAALRAMMRAAGCEAPIEVDGGVDLTNVRDLTTAGASILVAGSAVFGTPDPGAALQALRRAAEGTA